MTMQIVITARDNQFVLASDTKSRVQVDHVGIKAPPKEIINVSKIRIAQRHGVAVAMAGTPNPDSNPAQEFADYVSSLSEAPLDFSRVIADWGNGSQQQYGHWRFTLLIVNPKSNTEPIWIADLSHGGSVTANPYYGYRINGDETNPAIMFPEYCKCDVMPLPDLNTAINIAALTLLMGAELNPYGVGGLEIWRYSGDWQRMNRLELESMGDRFAHLRREIDNFVYAPNNSASPQT